MTESQKGDVVALYRVGSEQHFLLLTLPNRTEVQLLRFEPLSGALQFSGTLGYDVFTNRDEAVSCMRQCGEVEVVGYGEAVLGYVVIGTAGLLLLVEKARVSALLPGDIQIKTVALARWHRISCKADLGTDTQSEVAVNFEAVENRINKILDFPINGAHWYCEDADVSRPFPSQHAPSDPSWQFTWNAWLTESFRSVDMGFCCPALMEGTAESKDLIDGMGDPFNLVLLSRRTRLNPGTRYNARGLNDLCEPGNEIECEQIVWKPAKEPNGKVLWNRYSWRRGTVPIRWSVNLKNSGLGEAEIVIREQRTFAGCKRYIRRLQKRFTPIKEVQEKLTEGIGECITSSEKFPIVFVSLLRKGLPDKSRSETNLAAAFDRALFSMRKMHQLHVSYYGLDWHEMDKQLGTQGLIEALWITMKDEDVPTTRWRGAPTMHWYGQQQGLARYNCADSLDRTNIASFFLSVQIFVEQCRRLELAILIDDEQTPVVPNQPKQRFRDRLFGGLLSSTSSSPGPYNNIRPAWPTLGRTHQRHRVLYRPELPVGWEAKVDKESGRTYFVDHINKRTSWTLPKDKKSDASGPAIEDRKSFRTRCREEMKTLQAWGMLDATVEEVKRKVLPEALSSIAEVFLQNGDRNAFFYTGSQAMHSDKIMIFEPETSQLKKNTVGGASNSFVAIARRYNNIVKDSDRQTQIELFLGIDLERHFLSSPTGTDLQSLNIIYKPKPLQQDVVDSDDDADDPVSEIAYPSLSTRTVLVREEEQLDTRRSLSSPNLSYEYGKPTPSNGEEHLIEGGQVQDAVDQVRDFEEGTSLMTPVVETSEDIPEPSTSTMERVTGLRELTACKDPLL